MVCRHSLRVQTSEQISMTGGSILLLVASYK